jgi:Flp pilus assembly protein TadG
MHNLFPFCLRNVMDDRRGATAVEFAFVAPILIGMVMGIMDLGHKMYTKSVMEGEVAKAARSSALESATTADAQNAIDAKVRETVTRIAGNDAVVNFERMAYNNYVQSEMKAEEYVDANNSDDCDNGETFTDANGNGEWDADSGMAGQGNAKDVQRYTVIVNYQRKFPTAGLFGWNANETVKVTTLLRNQPFSSASEVETGTCT